MDAVARRAAEVVRDAGYELEGVDGWLLSRDPAGGWVLLIATDEAVPRLAFAVELPAQAPPRVDRKVPPAPLGPGLPELFAAQRAAMRAAGMSPGPVNRVVLTADAIGQEGLLVYLFEESYDEDEIVTGPHWRVLVRNGRVREVTPLSGGRGVVRRAQVESYTGEDPPGLSVELPGADAPSEAQVFLSLRHGRIPVHVATSRGWWRVEGSDIRFLGAAPPAKGSAQSAAPQP